MNRMIRTWGIVGVLALLFSVQIACQLEAQRPLQREGAIFSVLTQVEVRSNGEQYLHLTEGLLYEGGVEKLVGWCMSLNDSPETTARICTEVGGEAIVPIHDFAKLNRAVVPSRNIEGGCWGYTFEKAEFSNRIPLPDPSGIETIFGTVVNITCNEPLPVLSPGQSG